MLVFCSMGAWQALSIQTAGRVSFGQAWVFDLRVPWVARYTWIQQTFPHEHISKILICWEIPDDVIGCHRFVLMMIDHLQNCPVMKNRRTQWINKTDWLAIGFYRPPASPHHPTPVQQNNRPQDTAVAVSFNNQGACASSRLVSGRHYIK